MDEHLIKRAAEGDTEAFRIFVEHYTNAVYAAAYGIIGDFHIAQDLTQEVFLRSYSGLSRLEEPAAAGSWLYTMTRNVCLDWLRKHRRQPVPSDQMEELVDNRFEEQQRRRQTSLDLWEAMQTLDDQNRTVVVLQLYGYSLEEIGAFLGLTVKAVDSRLRRTRQKIKWELMNTMDQTMGGKRLDASAFAQKIVSNLLFPSMLRFPQPQMSNELMDKVKRQFEESNPNVKLNVQTVHNYHDKLRKYMSEDQAPDLIVMDSARCIEYNRLGYLADLSPYIERDQVDRNGFVQPFLETMSVDNKVLGIPMAGATMALFYNKDLFDKAGLSYPDSDWTWEEFAETAQALMASHGDPKQWRYGASICFQANILEPIVLSKGGRFVSPDGTRVKGYLDSPQTIEAVKWAADLIHVKKAAAPMIDYGFRRLFWEGRMGMIIDYMDAIHPISKNMKEAWDVAPMPMFAGGTRVNVAGTGGIGISAKAAYPEQAWQFLKQMLVEQSPLSEQHAAPEIAATHSLMQELGQDTDPIRRVFIDELQYAVPGARATSVVWGSYFATQINQRLLTIVQNRADVEETLIWAAEAIESNLEMFARLRGES